MNEKRLYVYDRFSIVADPTEVLWDLESGCDGDLDEVIDDSLRQSRYDAESAKAKETGTEPPPPLDANDRMAINLADRTLVKAGRLAFKLPGLNDNGPGSGPTSGEVLDLVYNFINWLEKKDESTATTAT